MIKRLKELWFKLVAYSNEKGITEKLKVIWVKIWGKEPDPIEEFDVYQYGELSEADKDSYMQQKDIYNKKLSKLKFRRFVLKTVMVILIFIISGNIISTIRSSYLVNCLGKDVCIYRGPKNPSPGYWQYSVNLGNGDIFLFSHSYKPGISRELFDLLAILRVFHIVSADYTLKLKHKISNLLVPSGWDINLYSAKHKKFKKFKNLLEPEFYPALLFRFNSAIYLIGLENKMRYCRKFNTKTMTTEDCSSNYLKYAKKYKCRYIGAYNQNYSLFMSNNSHLYEKSFSNIKLNKPERLYLVDKNFEQYPLPDFAQQPLYAPPREDFKILSNGKIIIPIRGGYRRDYITDYNFSWDHIEIYNPETNKFTAEKNIEALKDNYFDIELPNGNILFINKDSSWIFNNKTDKFEKCSPDEIQKYKQLIRNIDNALVRIVGVRLSESVQGRTKFIKLNSNEYLLTCGYRSYEYPNCVQPPCSPACNNTLYINFNKMEYKKGPTFLYPHNSSAIESINDNTTMVIGGVSHRYLKDEDNPLPHRYVQIIKINKK